MTEFLEHHVDQMRATPLSVTLSRSLSKRDQRHFFKALRTEVGRMRYPMAHSLSRCIVLTPTPEAVPKCRSDLAGWLVNQAGMRHVVLGPPVPVLDALLGSWEFTGKNGHVVDGSAAALPPEINSLTKGALKHAWRLSTQEPSFVGWRWAGLIARLRELALRHSGRPMSGNQSARLTLSSLVSQRDVRRSFYDRNPPRARPPPGC